MPIQAPQWTEYLNCPICERGFEVNGRPPISLGCGHTICKTCLANLQSAACPFDQGSITIPLNKLPVNTALVLLIDGEADLNAIKSRSGIEDDGVRRRYLECASYLENLATFMRPSRRQQLSRPMQRKLVTLINCQILEEEGRSRSIRAARSLGERSVTELILQHQNSQQLSSNLWAAVRARGCQFLGPAMQEEVLKLVLLALEDGTALSRKVLVMFVVQRLEADFPQASKTSIGHVVQLLYRASCFKVTKREGDSSLMQLKEEFRTYETLRREHDAQIVQIATDAGLRIAPDQWSSLLYGDTNHKSHMQSIIDKLQTPQSFSQSIQDLLIALQRTGDPGHLGKLRNHLDFLAALDPSPDASCSDWQTLSKSLYSVHQAVSGLQTFIEQCQSRRFNDHSGSGGSNSRYKTNMCRDLKTHGSCPRGRNCTFAHSLNEIEHHRKTRPRGHFKPQNRLNSKEESMHAQQIGSQDTPPNNGSLSSLPPVAQVAPVPRGFPSRGFVPIEPVPAAAVPAMISPAGPVVQPVAGGAVVPPVAAATPVPQGPMGGAALMPIYSPTPTGERIDVIEPGQDGVPLMRTGTHSTSEVLMPLFPNQILPANETHQLRAPSVGTPGHMAFVYSNDITGSLVPVHESNLERFPIREEAHIRDFEASVEVSAGVVTKSLSALHSRKEEIIEYLEDLVGCEETNRIKSQAKDTFMPCTSRYPLSNAAHFCQDDPRENSSSSNQGYYSIWTSRSIATIGTNSGISNGTSGSSICSSSPFTQPDYSSPQSLSTSSNRKSEEKHSPNASPLGEDDELIPFSDTPDRSCRFGPISRRSALVMQEGKPSQSQAIISDEPLPTAVVRHSKQMHQQIPSIAQFYQNGSRATLHPVAVGVNGEIGYVAVPEQQLMGHQSVASSLPEKSTTPAMSATPVVSSSPWSLSSTRVNFSESDKTKHEITMLQRQISNLNVAHMDNRSNFYPNSNSSSSVHQTLPNDQLKRKDELAKELQLIESVIRDREHEIMVNHMRIDVSENPDRSLLSISKGMVHFDQHNLRSISTTANSRTKKTP